MEDAFSEIETRLGLSFSSKKLLATAFIHRSYWNEHQDEVSEPNERLEFLGDAVLQLIVSEYLYVRFPERPEGELSQLRTQIVEASRCMELVDMLGVEEFLRLGKGEEENRGKGRASILADLFEALLGAIYLDKGFEETKAFFYRHFEEKIAAFIEEPVRNWKAELQDRMQKEAQIAPIYEVLDESGAPHEKWFHVGVFQGSDLVGEGEGPSKKEAQQAAAADALARWER